MGFLDRLLGPPTLKSVTESLAKELRARGEDDLVVNMSGGFIDVRRHDQSGTRVHAQNLLHELVRTPRAKRLAAVKRFLDGMPITDDVVPDAYSDVENVLMPVLRAADDFGLYALTAESSGREPMPTVAARPFVNDVVVALVIDLPHSMALVSERRLEEWGVSFDQALDRALQNLRGLPEQGGWKVLSPGVWSGEWDDSYESSRMLLPDLIRRLELKDPVVMVPHRGAILATSAHDGQGIEAMLSTVEKALKQHNRWVSFFPATLDGTTWRTFSAPEPLLERFRGLAYESTHASYDQQKQLLEKKFEADRQDSFVATYMVMETKEGKRSSMATWPQGVTHTLLPVVDVVVFVTSDEEPKSVFVPWENARDVVSHLMLPTHWMPVRYQIRQFPSKTELEALRAVALPYL